MTRLSQLGFGVAAVLVVASGSLALHYRQQSEIYRHQLEGALADAELDSPLPEPAKPAATKVVYVTVPAAVTSDATAFQSRIGDLERQLADQEVLIASLRKAQASRAPDPVAVARIPEPMFSPSSRTNDAARRADFEKRREEFQQKVQNSFAKKAAFLLERDTSKLSEEEREQYEQMVGLLDETWKLTAQMQSDLPMDQRHQVMHAVREKVTALNPLLASERTREFHDLGVSLGYNEAEAAQFVSYLTEVIDVTSVNTLFPQMHGRRGGGGGGGGSSATPGGSPPAAAK
jgi:hypothetical protein